jgi:hypothetical protein
MDTIVLTVIGLFTAWSYYYYYRITTADGGLVPV